MEYVCVNVRFYIWNGKQKYTVHYATALNKWYVFDGVSDSGALYSKDCKTHSDSKTTIDNATDVLLEYLNTKG
jgi:hypothetical protein